MDIEQLSENLTAQLKAHENRSQWRYEELMALVNKPKENSMDGVNSDKVNINLGEGRGGGSDGLGAMAAIAALGQRNENRRDDGGFGGNGLLGIAALAMLRRGFGDDGDGRGHNDGLTPAGAALIQNIAQGVNQNGTSILEGQSEIQQTLHSMSLGILAGFGNLKDAVQNFGLANLLATKDVGRDVATGTLSTQIAINTDGDRTRALITAQETADLRQRLTVAELQSVEERARGHADRNSHNVTQTVVQGQQQTQAQWQQQRFDDERFTRFAAVIGNQVMAARQGQDVINFGGTMTASGTQAAANTQVR